MSGILVEVVIIAVLLVLNGIFSMSELAIVAAKRIRLEHQAERGDAGARAALAIASNPSEFLSTVQVGITLVGVIASVYGGATIAEVLAGRLETVPWLAEHAEAAALTIVVATITYLSVIIGELVPKRIALGNPERVAAIVARPMRLISRIGSPLVRLLTGSTQLILRLFGLKGLPEPGLTEEEIHAVIEQGAESGVVPEVEHEIVENVFRLGDRHVSSVMTARPDIEWVDVNATPQEIRDILREGWKDWVLVCEDDVETIRGIVHASSLLSQCLDGHALGFAGVLEQPIYVPATTPVFKLLDHFREQKKQVAVVLDEYGGIDGIVTLTNILSDLVGTPTSDPQAAAPTVTRNPDASWTADGGIDIHDLAEQIGVDALDAGTHHSYRTLGGFLMAASGRVPKVGDAIKVPGFTFRVEAVDGRRIERVRIEPSSAKPRTP
jgi:putative hemolysin